MISWLKNLFSKPAVNLTHVTPSGRVYGHIVTVDRDAETLPSMEVAEPSSWLYARDLEDVTDDTAPTTKMSAASTVELVAQELFEDLRTRVRTPPSMLSEFCLDNGEGIENTLTEDL